MMSIPSFSHASSIAVLLGLRGLRMALKPTALSRAVLRSSAACIEHHIKGPAVELNTGASKPDQLIVDAQAVARSAPDETDSEKDGLCLLGGLGLGSPCSGGRLRDVDSPLHRRSLTREQSDGIGMCRWMPRFFSTSATLSTTADLASMTGESMRVPSLMTYA
ncbi:hypothetical protein ASC66_11385 [Leifsonia sp. Root4]|nr:hypothetical protein ASC66_11385 [Leifsonia sp. Root4]